MKLRIENNEKNNKIDGLHPFGLINLFFREKACDCKKNVIRKRFRRFLCNYYIVTNGYTFYTQKRQNI